MSRKVVLFNGIFFKNSTSKYIYVESYTNAEMQTELFEIFPRVFFY